MTHRQTATVAALLVGLAVAEPAACQTLTWDANGAIPPSGEFNVANNWNPNQLPGTMDELLFSLPETYTVTLDNIGSAAEAHVTAGDVGLASSNAFAQILALTLDGGDSDADIDVSGGTLSVGQPFAPVFLLGGDAILFVGVVNDGTLNVVGGASRLDAEGTSRTHAIGGLGGDGTLNLIGGATANIGTAGTLDVGSSNSPATDGVILVDGSVLNTGNLDIADRNTAATGVVTVTGNGAVINQVLQDAYLTIGSTSGGAGMLHVEDGGLVESGMGDITINATGTLSIGLTDEATFNANGNVVVDGGTINRGAFGVAHFNLAPSKTLTASNDAQMNFTGSHLIEDGTLFTIESGADFSVTGSLGVGSFSGPGNLEVTGEGSTISAGGTSSWGRNGWTGIVTLSDHASGNVGNVEIARSTDAGTTGVLTVQSGAELNVGSLTVAQAGGSTTQGAVFVTGAESTLTQPADAPVIIGHQTDGTATVTVQDEGTISAGPTTINATGTLTIDGGTFNANGDVQVNGGSITRSSGSFNLGAGRTLTATDGAQVKLGSSVALSGGTTWNINGGAELATSGQLPYLDIGTSGGATNVTIDGDESTLTIGNNSFWGDNGHTAQVTVRGGAAAHVGIISLARSSLAGTTGTIDVESGATMTTHNIFVARNGGEMTTGRITVTGAESTLTQTGSSELMLGHATSGTAEIKVCDGGAFRTGSGDVTINTTGVLNVNGGSATGTFEAKGPMTVGGAVNVRAENVLPDDPGGALLINSGMTIDDGTVMLDHGVVLADAITLLGSGEFNFNGGRLSVGAFEGDLTNDGGVLQVGGSMIGITTIGGDYTQETTATLDVLVGGLVPGLEFDQLVVSDVVELNGGMLDVRLSANYEPAAGDTFEIISASPLGQSVFGTFATTAGDLPSLPTGLQWAINYGANNVVLAVVSAGIPGDYNNDGVVNAADYVLWRKSPADFGGDPDGYETWRTNFGTTAGSGSAGDSRADAAVPEPGTLLLAGLATVGSGLARRRKRLFEKRRSREHAGL